MYIYIYIYIQAPLLIAEGARVSASPRWTAWPNFCRFEAGRDLLGDHAFFPLRSHTRGIGERERKKHFTALSCSCLLWCLCGGILICDPSDFYAPPPA